MAYCHYQIENTNRLSCETLHSTELNFIWMKRLVLASSRTPWQLKWRTASSQVLFDNSADLISLPIFYLNGQLFLSNIIKALIRCCTSITWETKCSVAWAAQTKSIHVKSPCYQNIVSYECREVTKWTKLTEWLPSCLYVSPFVRGICFVKVTSVHSGEPSQGVNLNQGFTLGNVLKPIICDLMN